MRILWQGLSLALIQVMVVGSVGGKLLYDRAHCPRVWVKATPVDPKLPIRGRYLQLGVVVDASAFPDAAFEPVPAAGDGIAGQPQQTPRLFRPGRLVLDHDRLVAQPISSEQTTESHFRLWHDQTGSWAQRLSPLSFFIPEHAKGPSVLEEGEELWVEVTVTPSGDLRPLRLAVKKNGQLLAPNW